MDRPTCSWAKNITAVQESKYEHLQQKSLFYSYVQPVSIDTSALLNREAAFFDHDSSLIHANSPTDYETKKNQQFLMAVWPY